MTTRVATLTLTLPRRLFAFRANNWPLIPLSIIGIMALLAIFAEVIAPYNPEIGILGERFKPPAWIAGGTERYLLGTDHLGRDVL